MKRIVMFLIVLGLAQVAMAQSAEDLVGPRRTYIGSDNKYLNPLYTWAYWMESQVSSGANVGTGKTWYVDSGVANAGSGTSWTTAYSTIDEAINACSDDGGASRGDIIKVAEGHAETVTGAAGFDLDVAGTTIVFCGNGALQGTITFADTDATVVIGAANCAIIGGRFLAGISEVVMGISIEAAADDCALIGCQFPEPLTATFEFDKAIMLASGADRLMVANCTVYSADTDGATDWLDADTGVVNGLMIIDNTVYGSYSQACVYSNKACKEVTVVNGRYTNTSAGQYAIEFSANTTGWIENVKVQTNAYGTAIDPGVMGVDFLSVWNDTDHAADATASPIFALAATDVSLWDLATNELDHFMKTAIGDTSDHVDMATWVANDTVLANLASISGDITDYDRRYDSLEALGDDTDAIIVDTENLQSLSNAVLSSMGQMGVTLSKVWYVDSVAGSDGNDGTSWEEAEATLAAAIAESTSNQGDVIFLAPDHTETLANAQLTLNKAGVRIIGLGKGTNRPEFLFGHANSSWDVTVDDIWIENVIFRATITGVLIGVDFSLDASHFNTLKDCLFEDAGGGADFVVAVNMVAGADFITLDGCEFISPAAGATDAISSSTGVCDRITIKNCRIFGDYSTAGITTTQTHTGMLIQNNVISNYSAADYAIKLTGAPTGQLVNNYLYTSAYATTLDPGSLMCIGNLAVDAIDEGGHPIPALADSTDNYIGTNSSNNDATTASVIANKDGSVVERLEALQAGAKPYYGHPNYIALAVNLTSATWNTAAAQEILAVTGSCRVQILIQVTGTVTSAANGSTVALGYAGNTAAIFAATDWDSAADAWAAGDIISAVYGAAATSPVGGANSTSALTGALFDVIVINDVDIGFTIGGEAATGGTLIIHMWWTPLDATGSCVAGDGSAL